MVSSVPTYESVVSKYALGAILAGGDLQLTPQGNIAVTADGDLQFGNDKCNAVHRLVLRWCYNARILEILFALITQESQRTREAESDRNSIASSLFTNRALIETFHALAGDMAAGEFGGAACGGAVMVVISNILLRYKHDLTPVNAKWAGLEPKFSGYSFGEVVVAAANNFRHHDEWARATVLDARQQKSIDVINAALAWSGLASASVAPWRRNACADLVPVIGGSDFSQLEQHFFEFAKAMIV